MWFGPNVKLHQNGAGTSTEGRPTHPYPAFIVGRIFYLLLHPPPPPIHQPILPLFCMKNHPRIPIEVSLQYFCWNKPKVAGECRNSFLLGGSLYNSDEKMTGCFWLTDPELLVYESYSFLGNMRWSNLLFCIRYGYIYAQQVVCPGFMYTISI